MDFTYTERQKYWIDRVSRFMEAHIYPAIPVYEKEMAVEGAARWKVVQVVEELKAKAKAEGLWNMFIPSSLKVSSSPIWNMPVSRN